MTTVKCSFFYRCYGIRQFHADQITFGKCWFSYIRTRFWNVNIRNSTLMKCFFSDACKRFRKHDRIFLVQIFSLIVRKITQIDIITILEICSGKCWFVNFRQFCTRRQIHLLDKAFLKCIVSDIGYCLWKTGVIFGFLSNNIKFRCISDVLKTFFKSDFHQSGTVFKRTCAHLQCILNWDFHFLQGSTVYKSLSF